MGFSSTLFAQTSLSGAGASFPYPVYSLWSEVYQQDTKIVINYESVGSSMGIDRVKAKQVDFGASNVPLQPDELNELGLIQFPMVIGGVVPVVNINGLNAGKLQLSGTLLVDIFLGEITNWNHPRLAKENPLLELPDLKIAVVHRSDGSGTTWIFTDYLSKVSKCWKEKIGRCKKVNWPVGLGAKNSDGVARYVQRIDGAIGYVQFTYARQRKMSYVRLINRSGVIVSPSQKSFQAAAAHADWDRTEGFYLVLTDQPSHESWPITGASFILIHKSLGTEKTTELVQFFDWCYSYGQPIARKLDYVPIPSNVIGIIQDAWVHHLGFVPDQTGRDPIASLP